MEQEKETYYQRNKEKIKIYEEENKEKRLEYRKRYNERNKEKISEYNKKRYREKKKRKRRSDDLDWRKDFEVFRDNTIRVLR